MRRQVRVHPAFYARLNLTGTPELRVRFLAGHLPGVEEDFANDFDGQLAAIDGRSDVRMVIGVGDGMTYAVLADLDNAGVVVIRGIVITPAD